MAKVQKVIQKVIEKYDLNQKEAEAVMETMLKGEATSAQIAAFMTALRLKGEVITELVGMAKALAKQAVKIKPLARDRVDIVGTDWDLINTFNISTLAAFVAAGAGISISKYCSRSINDTQGSADLLEGLGVNLKNSPKEVEKCINKLGIGFLVSEVFQPALQHTLPAQKEIGIRTAFCLLETLANPSAVNGIVLGVYDPKLTTVIANVVRMLGFKRAFVVHGLEGLDEISINGETRISELRQGIINTYSVVPEDFGMETASLNNLLSGSLAENVRMARVILSGKENSPRTDIVLLNAAAAIAASGKAATLHEGLQLAHTSLFSGQALAKLEAVIELTKKTGATAKKTSRTTKTTPLKKRVKKKVVKKTVGAKTVKKAKPVSRRKK